jgi:hypothetical protein
MHGGVGSLVIVLTHEVAFKGDLVAGAGDEKGDHDRVHVVSESARLLFLTDAISNRRACMPCGEMPCFPSTILSDRGHQGRQEVGSITQ